jgi:hypothetical protein
MLQCVYECAPGAVDAETNTPILGEYGLKAWIKAEYEVFLKFVRHIVNKCLEYSGGNAFAQGQSDGVSFADHNKYLSIGFQCIAPGGLSRNLAVCLGLIRAVKGEDGSGGGTTENTKREMEKKSMAVVEQGLHAFHAHPLPAHCGAAVWPDDGGGPGEDSGILNKFLYCTTLATLYCST